VVRGEDVIQGRRAALPYTLDYRTPDQAVAWLRFREAQLTELAIPLEKPRRPDWRRHCEWYEHDG
jgi:hypothetical protein